jgi:hypothetical protein
MLPIKIRQQLKTPLRRLATLNLGLKPCSTIENRILNHLALLLGMRSKKQICRLFANDDIPALVTRFIATMKGWDYSGFTDTLVKDIIGIPGNHVSSVVSILVENNYDIASTRNKLGKVGGAMIGMLSRRTSDAVDPSSSWCREILPYLMQNNATAFALFAGLDNPSFLTSNNYRVLTELSSYRHVLENRTVWQVYGVSPDLESVRRLLEYASNLDTISTRANFISRVLIGVAIRELCQNLLNSEAGKQLLKSDVYRRLLWESLDSVLWYELIMDLYSDSAAQQLVDPVGIPPEPNRYLWLIAEYGYLCLGIERNLQIHKHFRSGGRHEALLYHSKLGYRDHLIHASNVLLLGLSFLKATNGPLRGVKINRSIIKQWFVAALFHDFGYVMELLPSLCRMLELFPMGPGDNVARVVGRALTEEIDKVNKVVKDDQKLATDLGQRSDHGVFSYLHLQQLFKGLSSNCATSSKKGGGYTVRYSQSLSAVLKHSIMSEQIKVRTQPLDALLVICDEIQEWLRPTVNSRSLTEFTIAHINNQRVLPITVRRVCRQIEVFDCRVSGGQIRFFNSSIPIVRLRYTDQNLNLYEPLSRILRKVYNLERIEGLNDIKLRVEIEIPWLADCNGGQKSLSELDILREYSLLYECGISPELYDIKPEPYRRLSRCVCHTRTNPNYDVICLDFTRFDDVQRNRPLVAQPPWEYEGELQEFKKERCIKAGVRCRYFEDAEEWAFHQLPDF